MKPSHVGVRLREARQAQNLGLRETAVRVGLSPGYLSRLEHGQVGPPGEEKLVALARVLGLDADEVLLAAGRIPSEVLPYLLRPGMAAFLRRAHSLGLTGEALLRLLGEG